MRLALVFCLLPFLPEPPRIEADRDPAKVTVVARLADDDLNNLPAGKWTQEQGEKWLRMMVVKKDGVGLPMVGTYERSGNRLTFKPRFDLEAGALYRASFGTDSSRAATTDHRVPERPASAPATVVKILPGSDELPANHLKFYIYFSAPMRGGRAIFDQICIVDADGKEIPDPWLRDELWDETDQVLIIYIHPGRIKWGLLLRQTLGPVLLPGKDYSFVVRGSMLDARGQKLGKDHVKKFRTTAEQRTRIELADWKVQAVKAGSKQPLKLDLPRSIDHTCLQNHLTIKDAHGKSVAGSIRVSAGEKSWSFTPRDAWRAEDYAVHVDPRLEDVAGNTPLRPFDLDLDAPVPAPQALELKFRPVK